MKGCDRSQKLLIRLTTSRKTRLLGAPLSATHGKQRLEWTPIFLFQEESRDAVFLRHSRIPLSACEWWNPNEGVPSFNRDSISRLNILAFWDGAHHELDLEYAITMDTWPLFDDWFSGLWSHLYHYSRNNMPGLLPKRFWCQWGLCCTDAESVDGNEWEDNTKSHGFSKSSCPSIGRAMDAIFYWYLMIYGSIFSCIISRNITVDSMYSTQYDTFSMGRLVSKVPRKRS